MTIPLPIETERLLIRPFDAPDSDPMAEIYGDPEVMRHICLGVLDRERTTALLEEYRSAQDERGFSTWAVLAYHLVHRHVVATGVVPVLYALAMATAAIAAYASCALDTLNSTSRPRRSR